MIPWPAMKTVIMYAMKISSFEKNNTFPIQPMPIMIVSDNEALIQCLHTKTSAMIHCNKYHLPCVGCLRFTSLSTLMFSHDDNSHNKEPNISLYMSSIHIQDIINMYLY